MDTQTEKQGNTLIDRKKEIADSQDVSIEDFNAGRIDYTSYTTYLDRTAVLHDDFNSVHFRATQGGYMNGNTQPIIDSEEAHKKYLKIIRKQW